MATNPLQKYFRQPKIYISLPSKGLYSPVGSIENAAEEMPVMSMTGMDELLLKTPDALMNGEATVKVIESCCPNIKDAWEVSNLDLDLILVSIRIATYGNNMDITDQCPQCSAFNDYVVSLSHIVNHLQACQYENKIVYDDLTIFIKPLNYRTVTNFGLRNFELQKLMQQSLALTDEVEQSKAITELYDRLAVIQNESYIESIDSVQAPEGTVDEKEWISEWISNSEKSLFNAIKQQIEKNNDVWRVPEVTVECKECGHSHNASIQLDQSNFFVGV